MTPSPRCRRNACRSTSSTTPIPPHPGTSSAATAASSICVDQFDPQFFGISPARRRAWTRSIGCCSRWPGRRSEHAGQCPRSASPAAATGVFVGIGTIDYADLQRAHAADRSVIDAYHGTGRRPQHRGEPALLPVRPARAEPGARHRLLVVAGRRAPGLPQPARPARRRGAGGRRERDPDAGAHGRRSPRPGMMAPGGPVRKPSTPAPTATSAPRAPAWWCSSRSSGAGRERGPRCTR